MEEGDEDHPAFGNIKELLVRLKKQLYIQVRPLTTKGMALERETPAFPCGAAVSWKEGSALERESRHCRRRQLDKEALPPAHCRRPPATSLPAAAPPAC